MHVKRIELSHRALRAGTIAFDNAAISCRVRDISPSGACLMVASPAGIPRSFFLAIEGDQLKRACRAVWRTESRIGVEFDPISDGDAA